MLEQNKCKRPFKYGNKVPSRRWFSSPFFCLLNIYANANCLSFDFIEHTLVLKQNLNEINVSAFFNHGNKALSRDWFSSPFFCLLNICANANWLSFDFIERTLVPKQKLNEKKRRRFFQPWEQGALQALVLAALFLPLNIYANTDLLPFDFYRRRPEAWHIQDIPAFFFFF